MHPYPQLYSAHASGGAAGDVALESSGLSALTTAPPAEFDGPGDRWSPGTLLVGAVADCIVLGFRAVARASRFDWNSLECGVDGTLERLEGASRFTRITVQATLRVLAGTDHDRAVKLLEKAERRLEPTVISG